MNYPMDLFLNSLQWETLSSSQNERSFLRVCGLGCRIVHGGNSNNDCNSASNGVSNDGGRVRVAAAAAAARFRCSGGFIGLKVKHLISVSVLVSTHSYRSHVLNDCANRIDIVSIFFGYVKSIPAKSLGTKVSVSAMLARINIVKYAHGTK